MSDTNNPGDTPADGATPPPNPYGQPPAGPDPYAQPPAYGQQPGYGQPPAYGQQPGYAATPGGDHDRRPGTVTAAGVITIIFSGLSLLLYAGLALLLLVAKDEVLEQIESEPSFEEAGISADTLVDAGVAIFAVMALWCLIALILGFMVLRRSNGARIALVVSSAITILLSLLGIGSGVSALPLIAAIAVIVLLFTGGAGDWFKRRGAGSAPGPQQY